MRHPSDDCTVTSTLFIVISPQYYSEGVCHGVPLISILEQKAISGRAIWRHQGIPHANCLETVYIFAYTHMLTIHKWMAEQR